MGHQKRIKDEKGRHKILVGILCLLTPEYLLLSNINRLIILIFIS